MTEDVLVRVDNVSKRFCRSLRRSLWYGLQDMASELSGRRHGGGSGLPKSSSDVQLRKDEFWAVKDVSFELKRGQCMGLIGRNGAGKTTLLRMLNGLIKPDTGSVHVHGRVGALIALGAGFNPLLSGKENIYINSCVLGMTKHEIDQKLDEIISFAELEDSIDSPVQTYSSGMQVRLGFACAAVLVPQILILDEVLAVGDMNFQAKCWNKLGELRKSGCSFIIVSHQMLNIERLATHCLLLTNGQPAIESKDKYTVIDTYERMLLHQATGSYLQNQTNSSQSDMGSGSRRIVITSVSFLDDNKNNLDQIYPGQSVSLQIAIECRELTPFPVVEVSLRSNSGAVLQINNKRNIPKKFVSSFQYIIISIPSFPFCNDIINVAVTLWDEEMNELYYWIKGVTFRCMSRPGATGNIYALTHVSSSD